MSGSQLLAGITNAKIDGVTYQLEGKARYSVAKVKRDSLMGQDGFHGFKEMPRPGSIKMSLRDSGGLSIADFNAMRNSTVVLELANGKIVTGRNMGTVEAEEVDTEEATFEVSFEGPEVTEQTA
ncbi:phage tail tube protein [Burkholderia cepacia]|uniref:phage tail tube protein n=1 Tax=Burkholderia cepacia TaxID=292 RepID=UPI0007581056|nr:phage tail tube protein [Burkholderia cepacia]KUY76114.1 phage tail protein [Burkholderia cepacia]